MSEQDVELPDAGTFKLGEWVQGKATYPRFTTTVYLDREAAARAVEIKKEIDNLTAELEEANLNAGAPDAWASLADSAQVKPAAKIDELTQQHAKMMKQLQSSALTVVFGLRERGIDKRINNVLRKEFEELKGLTDRQVIEQLSENEAVAERRGQLQLKETVVEMRNADGAKVDLRSVTVDSLKSLVESLGSRDQAKIFTNMTQSITGGNVVDEAVDAGFPS